MLGVLEGVLLGVLELEILGVGLLDGVLDGVALLVVLGVGVLDALVEGVGVLQVYCANMSKSSADPPLNHTTVSVHAQSIYSKLSAAITSESFALPVQSPSAQSLYLTVISSVALLLVILYC